MYDKKPSSTLHSKMLRLYYEYLCIGGMPEAIRKYLDNNKTLVEYDDKYYEQVIENYLDDMGKYANSPTTLKCRAIYKSIPTQLTGGEGF